MRRVLCGSPAMAGLRFLCVCAFDGFLIWFRIAYACPATASLCNQGWRFLWGRVGGLPFLARVALLACIVGLAFVVFAFGGFLLLLLPACVFLTIASLCNRHRISRASAIRARTTGTNNYPTAPNANNNVTNDYSTVDLIGDLSPWRHLTACSPCQEVGTTTIQASCSM